MVWKKEKEKTDASVSEIEQSRKIVKMERSAEDANGGPLTADVHPNEVSNYEKAGWKRSE